MAAPRLDARTRVLLEGPIVSTLLRLATPNVLVMFVQASVGLIETYFVAKLGTDALAGVVLVFPLLMLMQMMSAGAVGGGISSAIARALGAGRRGDADALVVHALVVAVGFGLLFTLSALAGGAWLYGAMGGRGASLAAALTYSNVVFSAAVLIWIFNSLANVIRGTGNMAVPAVVTSVGAAVLIPLSPCLIFGWGPFPRLGVAGGAVAVIAYYIIGSLALLAYLRRGRSVVRLSFAGVRLRWPLFRDILRVGAVAALITVQTNLTIAIATGLVGRFGPAAIAGYGTFWSLSRSGSAAPSWPWWAPTSAPASVTARCARPGSAPRSRPASPRSSGSAPPRFPMRGSRCSTPTRRCSMPAHGICARSARSTACSGSAWRCTSRRRAPAGWPGH